MGRQKKSLDAYSKFGKNKFTPDKDQVITKKLKEEIKNANRSFKKGMRQIYKKQIKKQLEGLNHGK